MKYVVVPVFPGTNCDAESLFWIEKNLEAQALAIPSHQRLPVAPSEIAAVLIPGGFSYGDYLRAGALAARSPILEDIRVLARSGTPVLGICNGFQILCESGLLPGVLVKNITKHHHHFPVDVQLETLSDGKWPQTPWLPRKERLNSGRLESLLAPENFSLPMSCGMGRYIPAPSGSPLAQPWKPFLRYVHNENGSTEAIAGVMNDRGNVLGMMPHPERASERVCGGTQGLLFLLGLAESQGLTIRPGSELQAFAQKLMG